MQSIYFSVSTADIVAIAEGSAESMAAVEMVTMSTGTFTSLEGIEIIDSKSMTSGMETANKLVSAYLAPKTAGLQVQACKAGKAAILR